eukprot:CAMPEP_0182848768 /NCGR_PEP_ID=MMETSP0006_2-20121128/29178_1 /TAXON_ID=97485 /ORGANISM="Prymnesium parvum, Strain Texoma1" /LENGTH=149 /DNA_ID=CAMNT_0024979211 /DNA_START=1123 /DNA_END=1573 /DNA_ORIENTATION=-
MSAVYCFHSVGHVGLFNTNWMELRGQARSEESAQYDRTVWCPSASYGVRSRTFESVNVSREVYLIVSRHSCHTRSSIGEVEENAASSRHRYATAQAEMEMAHVDGVGVPMNGYATLHTSKGLESRDYLRKLLKVWDGQALKAARVQSRV